MRRMIGVLFLNNQTNEKLVFFLVRSNTFDPFHSGCTYHNYAPTYTLLLHTSSYTQFIRVDFLFKYVKDSYLSWSLYGKKTSVTLVPYARPYLCPSLPVPLLLFVGSARLFLFLETPTQLANRWNDEALKWYTLGNCWSLVLDILGLVL